MNKKGFTLIEILMVLVILVAITVAGTFGIQSIQKKSEEKSLEELYSQILSAADVYLNENETFATDLLNKEVDEKCIRIYTLQNEGLLSTSLTNPVTKKLIPGNLCVISYLSEDGTIKNSFNEEDNKKKVTLNVINGRSDIAYKNVHHKAVFTVTPNEGITTEDTIMSCDNKADIVMNGNVVTVTNVVKDTTCTVNFKVPTYNVKLNVTNGSVANTNLTVEKNKNAEFTITPNEGYTIKQASLTCNNANYSITDNIVKINNVVSDVNCNLNITKSEWSKYSLKEQTNYNWNKYNVNISVTYNWTKYNAVVTQPTYRESESSVSGFCVTYTSIVQCTSTTPVLINGRYQYTGGRGFYGLSTQNNVWGAPLNSEGTAAEGSYIYFGKWNSYNHCFFPSKKKEVTTIPGSSYKGTTNYGTVSSTSSSAYPSNGISGSYWYISNGSTTSYSKGSTNYGLISSASSDSYPSNGKSGSYWYVYNGTSTSFLDEKNSLIENVVAEYGTYPTDGRSGEYWYVRK